jgi:ribosomal protein L11 methyltransferase
VFAAIDCVWLASLSDPPAVSLSNPPAVSLSNPPSDDDVDRVLAEVDEFEPSAVEPVAGGVRIFFPSVQQQAAAHAHLAASMPELAVTSLLVPDEQWAERSQAAITPIRVGRVVVTPPWLQESNTTGAADDDIVIVVQPSMGFGTGHHQSTRLCLALLQRQRIEDLSVLDVGTGSGVLAVAAAKLTAATVLGIDIDPDAIDAAIDTVERNDAAERVAMQVLDVTKTSPREVPSLSRGEVPSLSRDELRTFDLLLGNLTGAMLCRVAPRLVAEVAAGGTLIVSGFDLDERDDVVAAFAAAGATPIDEAIEDRWMAMALRRG